MSAPIEVGSVVGEKYRLDAILGEGGFGIVYRATTIETGRLVAIKFLKPSIAGTGPAHGRFKRELRAVARLQSPYIPKLFDYGKTPEGALFMVTEYVDGEDLTELLLRRNQLDEDEAQHVIMQVLLSLDDAHRAGVLHRDIKPANIRIYTQDADPLRVKVLDFGIAKLLDDGSSSLTSTGIVLGTPRYLAPEVIFGGSPSPASDLYAVGLVARELLLGPGATETAGFQPEGLSRELTEADPVSADFRKVVNRLLARDPDRRYQTAGEAIAAIRDIHRAKDAVTTRFPLVHEARLAESPPRDERTRLWQRRSPAQAAQTADALPQPSSLRPYQIIGAIALLVVLLGIALVLAAERGDERVETLPPRPVVLPPAPAPRAPKAVAASKPAPKPVPAASLSPCAKARTPGVHRRAERGVTWHEYVPATLGERPPVVVLLRAKDVTSSVFLLNSGFIDVADDEGFVVIAPEASNSLIENPWEDERDLARIWEIVDEVQTRLCAGSVYLVGDAAGAVFAQKVACRDWVSGVAIYGSRYWAAPDVCPAHAPTIWLDPKRSPRLPWNGGAPCPDHPLGMFSSKASHAEMLTMWRDNLGCEGEPRIVVSEKRGSCSTWACERPFEACELDGGDAWPNMPATSANCDSKGANFPAARVVWEFFGRVGESDDQ